MIPADLPDSADPGLTDLSLLDDIREISAERDAALARAAKFEAELATAKATIARLRKSTKPHLQLAS